MALSGLETVLYEKPKMGIVLITLNRPERLNSLTIETFDRLNESWQRFRDDEEAKVAIITGSGEKAFCAGLDLKDQSERVGMDACFDLAKLKPGTWDGTEGTPQGAGLVKPTIAAINGAAIGGGFLLAMMSDLRIASEKAQFAIGEVKFGRGTPWAVPLLWQMPLAMINEMLYLGEMVSASRLYEVGWLNRIVPSNRLMDEAMGMAQILRDNAPLSVRAAKQLVYETTGIINRIGSQMAKLIYPSVYASEDAIEGPKAFDEGRKPIWKGK
jgi:enoyl-CoA hydratase/carnithine racemase